MLDWSDLRVVMNIHREGSMANAARVLKTSQPTLSRQLARIETELGIRLFDRRQGRLVVTEAGLIVTRQAESMERQLRGMEDSLPSIDNEMSGPIRISAPQQVLPFAFGDVFKAFQETYPDITLIVSISDKITDFASGKVDVVLRAEENPRPSLWGHRIARLNNRFFGHRTLLEAYGGNSPDITQAKGIPLIVHDGVVSSTQDETLQNFPGGRIVMRTDGLETSATFVQRGLGIARLPEIVGDSLSGVEAIKGLSSPTSRSLWILTHKDLLNVQRIRRFVDYVAEHSGQDTKSPAEDGGKV